MDRRKQGWAVVGALAAPIGILLGKLHAIGPNPGTFFALGVLATLAVGGIIHGLREGVRMARSNSR